MAITIAAVAVLCACERPFIEQRTPEIQVLSPRLDEVLPGQNVRFAVRAASFREIASVEVNGRQLAYSADHGYWAADITLDRGVNRITVRATDTENVSATDTLYGLVYGVQIRRDGPKLASERGGHAATILSDGSLLITGGARLYRLQALATALLYRPETDTYVNVPSSMHFPRIGHTATRLGDGRVLIAGGAHTGDITSVADLAEVAEVYDPVEQRFTRVPVSGRPMSRAFHSASYFKSDQAGQTNEFIIVFGGRGDIRAGTGSPLLGVRRDMATYQFRNDSLIFAGPVHASDLDGVFGHTVTPLGTTSNVANVPHLIAGTYFLEDGQPDDVNFLMSYRTGSGLSFRRLPPLAQPRLHHAATQAQTGVLLFGGLDSREISSTNAVEIFQPEADGFFRFPDALISLSRRWGHTATNLSDGRILLLGGFDASGSGRTTAEWFELR